EAASPRVEALLKSLTLEEKAGQLSMDSPGAAYSADDFAAGRIGAVLNYFEPSLIEKIAAVGRSAKGIPVLQALDVI
ncbi:hypothetical protein J8J40_35240, partial [Mycobacterium tuberculosis]|nr:hypothetical protein [Mycobacterium tuberculosis]